MVIAHTSTYTYYSCGKREVPHGSACKVFYADSRMIMCCSIKLSSSRHESCLYLYNAGHLAPDRRRSTHTHTQRRDKSRDFLFALLFACAQRQHRCGSAVPAVCSPPPAPHVTISMRLSPSCMMHGWLPERSAARLPLSPLRRVTHSTAAWAAWAAGVRRQVSGRGRGSPQRAPLRRQPAAAAPPCAAASAR